MACPSWNTIEVQGKRVELFTPERSAESPVCLLFLHGHGRITLRDNAIYTSELAKRGWHAVCPQGGRCWWGDRVCGEFDKQLSPMEFLTAHLLPELRERWPNVQVPVLGVSMGGQGALRLAYAYPGDLPVVAALSPMIDFHRLHGQGLPLDEIYETSEDARQDIATLWIHPLNWPRHQFLACDAGDTDWLEGAECLASKLSSTGIPYVTDFETRHGGHSWEYFNHQAPRVMAFFDERLEQERRRLPVTQ